MQGVGGPHVQDGSQLLQPLGARVPAWRDGLDGVCDGQGDGPQLVPQVLLYGDTFKGHRSPQEVKSACFGPLER